MPYGYIYLTTNKINGKKYIGQHKSEVFDKDYYGSGLIIRRATKKYREENFVVEVIEWCNSREELNEREKYWIAKNDAVESSDFYNKAYGGDGMTSEAVSGGKNNHAKPVRCIETGQVFSCIKEAYEFIGRGSSSIKRSIHGGTRCAGYHWEFVREFDYTTPKINNLVELNKLRKETPFKGKHHTEETRRRISELRKGERVYELMIPVVAIFSKKRYDSIGDAINDGVRHSYYDGIKKGLRSNYRGDFWVYEKDFISQDDPDYYARSIMEHVALLISEKKIEYDKYEDARYERVRMKSIRSSQRMTEICKMKDISGKNNPMYGKHHTEETRQKIREKNLGKPNPKVFKRMIDIESGEVFINLTEASKSVNRSPSTMVTQIKRGQRCGGRLFAYYDEYVQRAGDNVCL